MCLFVEGNPSVRLLPSPLNHPTHPRVNPRLDGNAKKRRSRPATKDRTARGCSSSVHAADSLRQRRRLSEPATPTEWNVTFILGYGWGNQEDSRSCASEASCVTVRLAWCETVRRTFCMLYQQEAASPVPPSAPHSRYSRKCNSCTLI